MAAGILILQRDCYNGGMITKAALLLLRDNAGQKELLFCKPKGKSYFVFPGGKQEDGETIDEALQRELQEELGAQVVNVNKLGVVEGNTPDGRAMRMYLYTGELSGEPYPQAEIESIAWMSRSEVEVQADAMTPMTLEHVLPFLTEQRIF